MIKKGMELRKHDSSQYLKSDNSINIETKTNNRIVSCFICKTQLEIQESTILYNSKWFHSACWEKSDQSKT